MGLNNDKTFKVFCINQSINDNHKADVTFDARRQHDALLSLEPVLSVQKSNDRGYTWFYKCVQFTFFKYP